MIIGDSMKKLMKDMDKGILIISIILFVFGLLNIVNASSQAVVIRYNQSLYEYFNKQLISIIIGLIVSIIIIKIPTKDYSKWSLFAYISVLVLLVYLFLFGTMHQGSKNWIKVGPMSLQPSEFAKPALIMITAVLFDRFYKKLNSRYSEEKLIFYLLGIILIPAALYICIIFFQKDLGTAIIITSIFGGMYLLGPIRKKEKMQSIVFVIIVGVVAALGLFAAKGSLLTPSQLSRFKFTNPCSRYEDGGYQICNGFIAINSGGLFGLGIGNSKQVSYLPESHTDSVFAIMAEEYGLIICTFVFILYIILLYRIFRLANKDNTVRGRYICYGVGIYIGVHIIVNLGGLFAMMPLTGVPLPFLSYGGSFTLALMISLAMVQRVAIEIRNKKIVVK